MREFEDYIKDQDRTAELETFGEEMLENLCQWIGGLFNPNDHDATEKSIARSLYKNTDCGAWIIFDHNKIGISIGSIVEGSDADGPQEYMQWPFTQDALNNTIANIEAVCDEMWHEANQDEFAEYLADMKAMSAARNGGKPL